MLLPEEAAMFMVMELGLGVSLWDLTDLADSQLKKKKKRAGWGQSYNHKDRILKTNEVEKISVVIRGHSPINILTSADKS